MKILKLAPIIALLLFSLLGCGSKDVENAPFTLDIVVELEDSDAFSEDLVQFDPDIAPMAYHLYDYGVAEDDITECGTFRSTGATCEEVALFLCKDEDSAETVVSALEQYVQGQILANKDYRPQEIPKLEDAILVQRGDSVLFAVAADSDAIKDIIEK